MKAITTIISGALLVLLVLIIGGAFYSIGARRSSPHSQEAAQEERVDASSIKGMKELPPDILFRLKKDFKDPKEYEEALVLISQVQKDALNVGWVQLTRAMIILAKGDLSKMKEMRESGYHGDPRDLLGEMMNLPGQTNNWGLTPFDMKE